MRLITAALIVSLWACAPAQPHTQDVTSRRVENWELCRTDPSITGGYGSEPDCAKITLPFMVQPRDTGSLRQEHVWFRGSFCVTGNPDSFYGISPGRVYFSDETSVNGIIVDSSPSGMHANMHEPRHYVLHQGQVKRGMNTVMIKVGIPDGRFGGLADQVYVSDKESFSGHRLKDDILYRMVPLAVIVFLFTGIIPLIVFYALHRREQVFMAGAVVSLSHVFYVLSYFSPLKLWPPETSLLIQLAHVPFFAMAMIFLMQALYRVYLAGFSIFALSLLSPSLVLAIFSEHVFASMRAKIIFAFALLGVITILYALCLARINRARSDRLRMITITAFVVLIQIIIGFELSNFITGAYPPGIVATYCIPVFSLAFSISAGIDIGRRFDEMNRIYQRARVSGQRNQRTLTELTRGRLDEVIAFIDENYRFDISREGLAAAVDMNHDYMSRQFRAYTGKKINDYINELRIKDAREMLCQSDATILDIALAVGFESLSTFNRAFKKATGTGPAEARKQGLAPRPE